MKEPYLASQIKSLRAAKGYSQEYLANQSNLSLRTVQRIESGKSEPHGDTLQRLAASLNVNVADLIEKRDADVNSREDKTYLVVIHLSALSFVIFPLLGLFVPFVLWKIKTTQVQGIAQTTKRVLNFQLTWFIALCVIYGFIFSQMFLHFHIPFRAIGNIGGADSLIFVIFFLYAYNILMILVNVLLQYKSKRLRYVPAIRFMH
jgi:transcriptional regulator with XRE-family HTH domain